MGHIVICTQSKVACVVYERIILRWPCSHRLQEAHWDPDLPQVLEGQEVPDTQTFLVGPAGLSDTQEGRPPHSHLVDQVVLGALPILYNLAVRYNRKSGSHILSFTRHPVWVNMMKTRRILQNINKCFELFHTWRSIVSWWSLTSFLTLLIK